jgi:hypothetical protein
MQAFFKDYAHADKFGQGFQGSKVKRVRPS